MKEIPITTMIDRLTREEARKRGIPIKYLVKRGWESIIGETGQAQRIKELEGRVTTLQNHIASLRTSLNDIRNKQEQQ